MDGFVDKIAEKFTAQDMIDANAAAEEKEMERLRMQVGEYDARLQEIRDLNLKNAELADQLKAVLDSADARFQQTVDNSENREAFAALSVKVDESRALCEALSIKVDENRVMYETLSSKIDAIKLAMETDTADEDEADMKLNELAEQLTDYIHKEDVKVYRNVEAAVIESTKKIEEMLEARKEDLSTEIYWVSRRTRGLKLMTFLSMLASLGGIAFWVLQMMDML